MATILIFKVLVSDLQLDVKGCRDVYASFDKYVEVERLEGDNKYHAEQHGLQVHCLLCKQLSTLVDLSLYLILFALYFLGSFLVDKFLLSRSPMQ